MYIHIHMYMYMLVYTHIFICINYLCINVYLTSHTNEGTLLHIPALTDVPHLQLETDLAPNGCDS